MRSLAIFISMLLAGCCWFSEDAPLPQPATDAGLSGAESNLDHLTGKRDSRVAAAVTVAKERTSEKSVVSELSVAQAMLPTPTAADLAFAKERAEKGDDAFYTKQLEVSRQLAVAIVEANNRYEAEKARKQAEFDARLKEKEMALAAEQEARQSDKWTYAGIGLVTLGLLALFLSPMKSAAIGVTLAGFIVGSFPIISKEPWFSKALIAGVAVGIVSRMLWNYLKKPKPVEHLKEVSNNPNESHPTKDAPNS